VEKEQSRKSKGPDLSGDPGADAAFEALRGWRKEESVEQSVAAFLIFGDAALRSIAARLPKNRDELLECSGVGNAKGDRYGDAVLKVIRELPTG
jgi:ATP-dependent DNA helicase RecQ